jgi:DNA polymerase zeta
VPFLITNGAPNSTLIKLVKSPLEVLNNEGYSINSSYYITKAIIPPLNRCFLLIGVNVFDWFTEIPKKYQSLAFMAGNQQHVDNTKKTTITQFFNSTNCAACDCYTDKEICENCRKNSQKSTYVLSCKIFNVERKFIAAKTICESCCNRNYENECISLDCPNLYSLTQIKREYKQTTHFRNILSELF